MSHMGNDIENFDQTYGSTKDVPTRARFHAWKNSMLGRTFRRLLIIFAMSLLLLEPGCRIIDTMRDGPGRNITSHVGIENRDGFTIYRFKSELQPLLTYNISVDGDFLWLGSKSGLIRYDKKENVWKMFGKQEGMPGDFAWNVDAKNGQVIAQVETIPKPGFANSVGFFELDPKLLKWKKTSRRNTERFLIIKEKGLRCEDPYGTFDQQIQDFKGGYVACYTIPDNILKNKFDVASGLSNGYSSGIRFAEEKLWVAHWHEDRGLSVIDLATDRVSVLKKSVNGLKVGGRKLLVDGQYLWVTQFNGVLKLNMKSLEATFYGDLPGYQVSDIVMDGDVIWVALHGNDCAGDCGESGLIKFPRTP